MKKTFTYGIINVDVALIDAKSILESKSEFKTAYGHKEVVGWYEYGINTIYMKKEAISEEINKEKYFERMVKRTIAHELTHFMDYNFWESFAYKEDDPSEHLAVFCSLHLDRIYHLTEMIYDWIYNIIQKENQDDN